MEDSWTKTNPESLSAQDDFFDPSFITELEELTESGDEVVVESEVPVAAHKMLETFLASAKPAITPLSESDFVALATGELTDRINTLVDLVRQGYPPAAVRAVDAFVVFFRALLPTLSETGSEQIKRVFFRLVPTLIHIAHNDFSEDDGKRREGAEALKNLEQILLEISGVRLAPAESELVFRSIDQLTSFISVTEYAVANQIICSRLLSIISRNKLMRALFRLMEAEVAVQRYLKERLGTPTPRFRLPDDLKTLAEYAPVRIFIEDQSVEDQSVESETTQRFIQIQLPHMDEPHNVVLHVTETDTGETHQFRLDALGTAALDLPDGTWDMGLIYESEAPPEG